MAAALEEIELQPHSIPHSSDCNVTTMFEKFRCWGFPKRHCYRTQRFRSRIVTDFSSNGEFQKRMVNRVC